MLSPEEVEMYRSTFLKSKRKLRREQLFQDSAMVLVIVATVVMILEGAGMMNGFAEWLGGLIKTAFAFR